MGGGGPLPSGDHPECSRKHRSGRRVLGLRYRERRLPSRRVPAQVERGCRATQPRVVRLAGTRGTAANRRCGGTRGAPWEPGAAVAARSSGAAACSIQARKPSASSRFDGSPDRSPHERANGANRPGALMGVRGIRRTRSGGSAVWNTAQPSDVRGGPGVRGEYASRRARRNRGSRRDRPRCGRSTPSGEVSCGSGRGRCGDQLHGVFERGG